MPRTKKAVSSNLLTNPPDRLGRPIQRSLGRGGGAVGTGGSFAK
jgi:hypothetical protein